VTGYLKIIYRDLLLILLIGSISDTYIIDTRVWVQPLTIQRCSWLYYSMAMPPEYLAHEKSKLPPMIQLPFALLPGTTTLTTKPYQVSENVSLLREKFGLKRYCLFAKNLGFLN